MKDDCMEQVLLTNLLLFLLMAAIRIFTIAV
jgi:hypothetical protein